MTGEIIGHSNQNEMTSEISTIAPDITFTAEPEKTISTEPKFGFFDRQMAELEPKVHFICILMRCIQDQTFYNAYKYMFIVGYE